MRREETDFKTLAGAFFQMFSRLVLQKVRRCAESMCFCEFVIPSSCYSSSFFIPSLSQGDTYKDIAASTEDAALQSM